MGKFWWVAISTTLGGQSRNNLGRLNADGTLDTGFDPGADGEVYSLVVQADGKILVGGWFTTGWPEPRAPWPAQCRWHAGPELQSGRPAVLIMHTSLPWPCRPMERFWWEAIFTTLGGQNRENIGRLNADGTVDTGFDPRANGGVNSLVVQGDGKILVAGLFPHAERAEPQ